MNKDRKKLLNENTIRRMMKLAEIDSLSETFIGDKFTVSENVPPEEQEEEPVAEEMEEEAPFDAEAEAPVDLPPEPDVEGEPAEVSITDEEASTLASVLEKLLAAQGEGEEGLPAEEPAELDMAPEDEELPPGGGGGAMYEAVEKEDALEEEVDEETLEEEVDEETLEEETDEDLQERLTNEIARRVAARLTKESRQEKVADQLAERIMHRLKNG